MATLADRNQLAHGSKVKAAGAPAGLLDGLQSLPSPCIIRALSGRATPAAGASRPRPTHGSGFQEASAQAPSHPSTQSAPTSAAAPKPAEVEAEAGVKHAKPLHSPEPVQAEEQAPAAAKHAKTPDDRPRSRSSCRKGSEGSTESKVMPYPTPEALVQLAQAQAQAWPASSGGCSTIIGTPTPSRPGTAQGPSYPSLGSRTSRPSTPSSSSPKPGPSSRKSGRSKPQAVTTQPELAATASILASSSRPSSSLKSTRPWTPSSVPQSTAPVRPGSHAGTRLGSPVTRTVSSNSMQVLDMGQSAAAAQAPALLSSERVNKVVHVRAVNSLRPSTPH